MDKASGSGIDLDATARASANPAQQTHVAALAGIVGAENVLTGVADRYAYSRDRLPFALYQLRAQQLPATLPCASLVRPAAACTMSGGGEHLRQSGASPSR